ncbi:MAG: sugar ABC transporter permease [Elusimicrobia bacterium]|nr:sugar ABC transporter permease [Elusimicrobiota bacterium]
MTQSLAYIKKHLTQYGMIIALISLMIFFSFLTSGVLMTPINLTNLILQNSYILILAVGMLLCTLTGNVDLSVGSAVALIGGVAAVLMVDLGLNPLFAVIISLLAGCVIGAWQGFWIAFIKVPAFIVTLAGMLIFRGFALVLLKGTSKGPFPQIFQSIASGFIGDPFGGITLFGKPLHALSLLIGVLLCAALLAAEILSRKKQIKYNFDVMPFGIWILKNIFLILSVMFFIVVFALYKGIPNILILLGALVGIYHFITVKTVPGRHVYAVGGNAKTAKLSGIKTEWVMFWVYTNMGLLAALAGIVFAARLNVATPKAGNMFELDAIAACYIGGSSVTGGVGTVVGAIIGGLFMGVLNNGMSIMGVGIDWQQAIKGFVLLGAVAFDLYSKSKSRSK